MLVRPTHPVAPPSRWSASTWAFVRRGDEPALASGGTLGGSQIGATASYRINGNSARPLAIAARLYSPLRRRQGAEAALGLSWRPLARIPVTIMAERREALGSEGRSAFSLLAHGGVSSLPVGPFRVDAYGQAGIVGINSRDLFADGAATAGIPLGSTENIIAGAGLWGAAQPGASRVDVGPSVTVRLPVQDRSVRVSADWRFRVAGGAAPGSGPSLTIGTDF